MCVLHTGSLTRIYIGIHRRARTGRHYYKTCICVNPFVLRFCRRRHRVVVVYRDHVASVPSPLWQSRRASLSLCFPPLTPRDLPPEVFGFLNANGTRARARACDRIRITLPIESLIGRSKEEDRVLRACHFTVPSNARHSFVRRLRENCAIIRPVQAPRTQVLRNSTGRPLFLSIAFNDSL